MTDGSAPDAGVSDASVSYELTIEASAATVFKLLTEPDGLRQWIAIEAEVEACDGGLISWTHENGQTVEGRFLEIDPPQRLVFTYGWVGHDTVPPESTVVEVTLTEMAHRSTQLTLVHRRLPPAERENHGFGWRHFLDRLGEVASERRVL